MKKRIKERIVVVRTLATVVCVICMLSPLAGAATAYFKGVTDTDWGTGSNWSTGSVPGPNDFAVLDQAQYTGTPPPQAVISSGNRVASNMTIGNAAALDAFNLDINGGTLTTGTGRSTGVTTLANNSANAIGVMNVNSGGTFVSNGQYVHVGRYGSGTMNVKTGGMCNVNTLYFVMGGAASTGGNGTLNVSGGTVNMDPTYFRTGFNAGTTQRINVTSGGTLNFTTMPYIGYSNGDSVMTIDGGTVSSTKQTLMSVSSLAHSTIDLKSGQLTMAGLIAGYGGTVGSHLYIRDGSMICNGDVNLALASSARLDMTGGQMTIGDGNTFYLGTSTGNGWFQLDGGVADLSAGAFQIGSNGWLDITEGTLKLAGLVTSLDRASGDGILGNLSFDYHAGEDITYVTIPEPATIALLVVGSGLMINRRRKN